MRHENRALHAGSGLNDRWNVGSAAFAGGKLVPWMVSVMTSALALALH